MRVPAADHTPPQAVLRVGGAEAVSGALAPAPVRLTAPVLRPTAVGHDKQGMARIRVSVSARTRIPPGALVRTELERSVRLDLARGHCPAADVRAIDGTAWADATSAWETEASSAPLRFAYAG